MNRIEQIDKTIKILQQAQDLDIDIIEGLIQSLHRLVKRKKEEIKQRKKEFIFEFEAIFGTSEPEPFIGKAFISSDGYLRTQYYRGMRIRKLPKKDKFKAKCEYVAAVGDIIYKRVGGSLDKPKERWFLITGDGQEKEVASNDKQEEKQRVIDYLRGNITMNELERRVDNAN